MWVLKTLKVFTCTRIEPSIIITYTLKEKSNGKIDMFKMWIKESLKEDFDTLNYANILYRNIKYFGDFTEKCMFKMYQKLFSLKFWEVPKVSYTKVNVKATLKVAPERNFIEFDEVYMETFLNKQISKFTKEATKNNEVKLPSKYTYKLPRGDYLLIKMKDYIKEEKK